MSSASKELELPRNGFSTSARYIRSPALAAQQTAEAMKLESGVDLELRDCDYGNWAGLPFEALQTNDPEAVARWLSDPAAGPPGGESVLRLLERIAGWLGSLRDPSGNIVAITHASVVRSAIVAALNCPPQAFWRIDIAPLSLTWLHKSNEHWTLVSANHPLRPLSKT